MTKLLWNPSEESIARANLTRFMKECTERYQILFQDYDELWNWSVSQPELFWQSVWDFCEIKAHQTPRAVLVNKENLREACFFPGATLNYAEHLLQERDERPAIIFHGENQIRIEWSRAELYDWVSKIQQILKRYGVEKGDRVVGFMPNLPHTIAAMLATVSLGAIWSSCSPDFGLNGLCDRFGQIKPKILFTATGYFYNGKTFDSLPIIQELSDRIPNLAAIFVVPYADTRPSLTNLQGKGYFLSEMLEGLESQLIDYEIVPFDHPLFVMFSSGTTGLPKCIVHAHGRVLLQHLKELQLHCDLKAGERLFYFTTCGWMMWNWMVSGLALGVTLVLFDGSPFYSKGNFLPSLIEKEKINVFGASAKYFEACAKQGVQPGKTSNLDSLRMILSTGSPLAPESFEYLYQNWKQELCVSSIAGGTDILGCFVGGSPISPVWKGEIQKRLLGMNVRILDEQGQSVTEQAGEFTCISPHPSQPVYFWNDKDGERYRKAYFDRYANIWHHGDFAELTAHGGIIMYGRSDATLNPGGVRIGTAEIYRQVERVEEVLESLVIGQQRHNDIRIVLFVLLRKEVTLDEILRQKIKTEIRTQTTPRHVPAKIIQIADIPRTKSGKIVELAVRAVIHGQLVKNKASLANPSALELYQDLPELAD